MTIHIPCGRVMGHGECCLDGHLCDACEEIERLRADLEDTRLAVRCFVRQVQFEGGIVTQEDFDRWPWIEQWILDKLPDEA